MMLCTIVFGFAEWMLHCRIVFYFVELYAALKNECCFVGLCAAQSVLHTSYVGFALPFWNYNLFLCQCYILLYTTTRSWNAVCFGSLRWLQAGLFSICAYLNLTLLIFCCLLIYIAGDINVRTSKFVPRCFAELCTAYALLHYSHSGSHNYYAGLYAALCKVLLWLC